MPIPLSRWRDADVGEVIDCPCGVQIDMEDGEELIERFALHIEDCPVGRDAAAGAYVEARAETG